MVRLRAYSQHLTSIGEIDYTTEVDLDLGDNVDIPITKKFQDLQSTAEATGSISKNFTLPATPINDKYFGYFKEPTANNVEIFNPKKKAPIIYEDGGVVILEGSIQLVQSTTQGYEVRLFGEVVTLFRSIGNRTLDDYDWSEYDHQLTYSGEELRDGLTVGLFDEAIRYGLVDYGQQWTGDKLYSPVYCPWYKDFKPYVNCLVIWKKILSDAGFTYDATTLEGIMLERYIIWHKEGRSIISETNPEWLEAAFNTSNLVLSSLSWLTVPFDDTVDPPVLFDPSQNGFVLPAQAVAGQFGWTDYLWQFQVTLIVTASFNTQIRVRIGGGNNVLVNVTAGTNQYTVTTFATSDFGVLFTDSLITCIVKKENFSASVTIDSSSTFRIIKSPQILIEPEVNMNLNAPPIPAADFVKYFLTKYNCVVIPKEENAKFIEITPFNEWNQEGDLWDLTNLVDYEKEIVIEPTTSLEAKQIILTDKDGKDMFSQAYKTSANRVFGQRTLLNSDNDFATGENKIETPAQSTPLNGVEGTDMIIPKLFDNSFAPVEFGLRVFRYGGNYAHQEWFVRTLANYTGVTSWPYFGHYEQPVPNDPDGHDDNFGVDVPFHQLDASPQNTAYVTYWQQYLSQLYSPSARLITLYAYLNKNKFRAIRFNEQILIKNVLHRLLSVENFQSTTEQSTQLKLLKIDPSTINVEYRPCHNIVVTAVTTNGLMIHTGDMTKPCCHALGGHYQGGLIPKCWQFGIPSHHSKQAGVFKKSEIAEKQPVLMNIFTNAEGKGVHPWVMSENQKVWGTDEYTQTIEASGSTEIDIAALNNQIYIVRTIGFKCPPSSFFSGTVEIVAVSDVTLKQSTATINFQFETDEENNVLPMVGIGFSWKTSEVYGGYKAIVVDIDSVGEGIVFTLYESGLGDDFENGIASARVTGVVKRKQ